MYQWRTLVPQMSAQAGTIADHTTPTHSRKLPSLLGHRHHVLPTEVIGHHS